MELTPDTFESELQDALKSFDRFIICIDKTPDECRASLISLLEKAITAYVNREPHLRHGIALDKQITVMLSQCDKDRPLCGVYFNLSSPYHKAKRGGEPG